MPLPVVWVLLICLVMACVAAGLGVTACVLAFVRRRWQPGAGSQEPWRRAKPLSNRITLWVALGLAVLTYAALCWERLTHPMVNPHASWEALLAFVVWSVCLLLVFGIPLALAWLNPQLRTHQRWPLPEGLVLGAGVGLAFWLLFLAHVFPPLPDQVILWLESLPLDVIAPFLAYLAALLTYAFTANKVIGSWRAKRKSRTLANGAVMWLAGAVMIIVSWAVVYFE